MSLPTVVHPLAERDVIEAWAWYEQQRPGLGDRFVTAVGLAIERAARWPDAGTPAIRDDTGAVAESGRIEVVPCRPPHGTAGVLSDLDAGSAVQSVEARIRSRTSRAMRSP